MANKTIGVVDDEAVFHWIVGEYLKRMEVANDIMSFYNGEEIFEYLSDEEKPFPDILLLDLNMPVCGGWRFLEKYETLNGNIKNVMQIYIVSSSIDPKDKQRAEAFTYIKDFISKPITDDVLLTILNN